MSSSGSSNKIFSIFVIFLFRVTMFTILFLNKKILHSFFKKRPPEVKLMKEGEGYVQAVLFVLEKSHGLVEDLLQ